jgi:undecaprenyl-diphosphatase
MNILDTSIIEFLNIFAQKSWAFDRAVVFLANYPLIKGGIPAAMLWWAWFKTDADTNKNRKHILATLLACFVALVVAQALEIALPYRPLPTQNPELAFKLPHGVIIPVKGAWSSFPSDHAVLYFALTAGFFFVSRAMGLFAFVFCFSLIFLARVYLGNHYPSDVIGGAAIGGGLVWVFNRSQWISRLTDVGLNLAQSQPSWFYVIFFLFTYQITTIFHDLRELLKGLAKYVGVLLT